MTTSRKKKKEPAPEFSCANCKHWDGIETTGRNVTPEVGFCRRYPPTFVPNEDPDARVWLNPPTGAAYLCGEHVVKFNS